MNNQDLPQGLVDSLAKLGLRAPSSPPTDAELEALGMQVGVGGAKEIIRRNLHGKRNPLRDRAVSIFKEATAGSFIKEARLAGYFVNEQEECQFRKGVDRGMASQLANPKARIEIKIVKAPAFV